MRAFRIRSAAAVALLAFWLTRGADSLSSTPPALAVRALGSSELMVTEACLGTMTFGLQNTQEEAHAQVSTRGTRLPHASPPRLASTPHQHTYALHRAWRPQ